MACRVKTLQPHPGIIVIIPDAVGSLQHFNAKITRKGYFDRAA